MLNFGASKPRVKGGPGPRGPPLDPHLDATPFDVTQDLIDLRHVWEPVDPLRCHCLSK